MGARKGRDVPAWFTSEPEFVSTTFQATNLGVDCAILSMIGNMYGFMIKCPEFGDRRMAPEINGSVEGRIGRGIAAYHSSVGAPAAAMLMETLIASGVKKIVMFGYAGSLSNECRVGDILVPDWGVREEGTSYHYLPGSVGVRASDMLVTRLCESLGRRHFHRGGIWSTDAAYRETRGKILKYAKKGIMAVDMESTGLMAIAMYRSAEFAPLVVISDELFGDRWVPDFDSPKVRRASMTACRAALRALGCR
ncbi:MAG: hypothetical protein A3K76_03765 [Euryarchaeota archaeon RBG_13_57_23]|nr:MAG: hypothetical protein A3K76_03765 [Euryarchaeota archaeon RBG_13_57_23]